MLDQIVMLRREQLKRKIEALDREVQAWIVRCSDHPRLQANYSQLLAIRAMLVIFTDRQRADCAQLGAADFPRDAYYLAEDIALAQEVWDYFRDRLELRLHPEFQARIAVADTVVWDCYIPVMRQTALASARLHEPPLTGLASLMFAQTWRRGQQPHLRGKSLLGGSALPIPIIDLPWDSLENLWELLAVPHEVGHNLETELGLAPELTKALAAALADAPEAVLTDWKHWRSEVIADLIAVQLMGPPYAEYLLDLLLMPPSLALADSDHPPPLVRMAYLCKSFATLLPAATMDAAVTYATDVSSRALAADAADLAARCAAIYHPPPAEEPVYATIPAVIRALMDTPLEALQGRTIRALMPYTVGADLRMRQAAQDLAAGRMPANPVEPRWCISAGRRAVSLVLARHTTADGLARALADLDALTCSYIERHSPDGLRSIPLLTAARQAEIVACVDRMRAGWRAPAEPV